MKISKLIATVAMATVLGAGAASAATYGSIPDGATNEGLQDLFGVTTLDGWYGTNLILGTPATVTATLMGAEAGNTNGFTMGGETLTYTGDNFEIGGVASITPVSDPSGKSITFNAFAGVLDFSFATSGAGGSVDNGSNPDNTIPTQFPGVNFFAHFGDHTVNNEFVTSGTEVWLFFDDDGASNDDNHDDLIVKLVIDNGSGPGVGILPVPAAGFLLFGALGGLAALGRRKKKAA